MRNVLSDFVKVMLSISIWYAVVSYCLFFRNEDSNMFILSRGFIPNIVFLCGSVLYI